MRDRLTTLAGALFSLVLIYGLFFASDEQELPITRPLTIEKGENGYFAMHQWLIREDVNTYSLRERFSSLVGNPEIPDETRNILITTLPYFRPLRESESGALSSWVASGNTLLVLAALNDTPDWSYLSATSFVFDLKMITGLSFSSEFEDTPDSEPDSEEDDVSVSTSILIFENGGADQTYEIVPRTGHPLMNGISVMKAESDFVSSVWRADSRPFELVLELATLRETDTPAIWQKKRGNGQIILVGSGSLLTNRLIASADNRKFVANLVRQNLGKGATVVFDDMHQGLSNIYDPDAFFSDSRLHYTIYFVVAFWLLYVVGSSNRLVDPRSGEMSLRPTDFIEATAGFIKGHMTRSAVGLWMYRSWFYDLRRQMHLRQNGEPVWQELDAITTLDKRLLQKMLQQYQRLVDGQSVNLIELHNTIHTARKAVG